MQFPTSIPAFKDNYIWMLSDPNLRKAVVIDPGTAAPVLKVLNSEKLTLTAILVTHHHFDHSGGALELMEKTGAKVFGPNASLFPKAQRLLDAETVILPELNQIFTVIEIPGHTLDHIAFLSKPLETEQRMLFCGDTLFTGGCGRVFEGTAKQMLQSLQKLKHLDSNTLIYCGHEYTEANLKFAKYVEPENELLQKRFEEVTLKRKAMQSTVPSTLTDELNTNPFLRTDKVSIHQAAERYAGKALGSEWEVFTIIRKWKNDFSSL